MRFERIFTPAAEGHGLCPWMNAPAFGRDVAPLGREEGCHGLCPWGSTLLNWQINSLFVGGFRVPEEEIHGTIIWEFLEVTETSIIKALKNRRAIGPYFFGLSFPHDDP